MCGITGMVRGARQTGGLDDIDAMTSALRHRGPDAGAIFVDEDAGVALGHRRLAIIELSERGAQPMPSANGRFVIVFNGEIYNHRELRRELEADAAVVWRGTSDTETLIECFSAWGAPATLRKAVGMFALALWDRAERRLTASTRSVRGEAALLRLPGPGAVKRFGLWLGAEGFARSSSVRQRHRPQRRGLVSAIFICSNALLDLS